MSRRRDILATNLQSGEALRGFRPWAKCCVRSARNQPAKRGSIASGITPISPMGEIGTKLQSGEALLLLLTHGSVEPLATSLQSGKHCYNHNGIMINQQGTSQPTYKVGEALLLRLAHGPVEPSLNASCDHNSTTTVESVDSRTGEQPSPIW